MTESSGIDAEVLFERGEGVTYEDFIMLPGFIDFPLHDVDLTTKLTRRIMLKTPLAGSPMDTVTESRMAISLALLGCIGFIHYNNTVEEQAEEVRKTKKFENGFIADPVVLSPDHTIADVDEIKERYGFSSAPITEDGTLESKLVGIVTRRDVDFEPDRSRPLRELMTTELVTASVGISLAEGNKILKESKKSKLLIVDDADRLRYLMSRTDLRKNQDFPLASKDEAKQLLVGAAVGTREEDRERLDAVVEAGADVVVFDSAQGFSSYQLQMIGFARERYPDLSIVGGNVVTVEQCKGLMEAGVDALRVGMGSGSICITQETVSVGRPQASAVYECSLFARRHDIPVIADGGIASIGHISRALGVGANTVMIGSLLAGTDEAPGEYFYEGGLRLKRYRGMGSPEAMERGGEKRYLTEEESLRVAQGVSGTVVDKGSVLDYVPYLMQGVRQAMQDLGYRTVPELHHALEAGNLRFERRSPSAKVEGGVHGLHSYTEPHNFRADPRSR